MICLAGALGPDTSSVASGTPRASAGTGQAASISLQGTRLVVVLAAHDSVRSPREASMAIEALAPRFLRVPVVLVARKDGATTDEAVRAAQARLATMSAP